MKLTIDPMPGLRAAKIKAVNQAFNSLASSHLDQAYAQKRQWASVNDERLKPEADLRGISVSELAFIILSKQDTVAEREFKRQQIMQRIDAAKSPEELHKIGSD